MTVHTPEGGGRLNVFFAGRHADKNYVCSLLGGAMVAEQQQEERWIAGLPFTLQQASPPISLAFVAGGKWTRRLFAAQTCFTIPLWVNAKITLDPQSVAQTFRKRDVRYEIGRIRQNGLTYEMSRDVNLLKHFYYRMFRPHAVCRYGDCAIFTPYQEIEERFLRCNGQLLLVKQHGRYISGTVLICTEDGPRLDKLGVLDGDPALLKDGAVAALYYFTIQYLMEKGQQLVILGGSRPFLDDGVLRYKRKWGAQLFGDYGKYFVLYPLAFDDAAADFLASHPFVFLRNGKLAAAVFTREMELDPKACKRIKKRYLARGLERLLVFGLSRQGGRWRLRPQQALR